MDQWLGLCASTARGTGLVPGGRTRIPLATQHALPPPPPPKKKKNNIILEKYFNSQWLYKTEFLKKGYANYKK